MPRSRGGALNITRMEKSLKPMPPRKRIGELLVEAEVLSQANVDDALRVQREKGGKIVEILMALGYLDPEFFLGGAMALFFLNFLIPGFPGLMAGVIVLIIGSVVVFGIAYLARRAIGGYTGDVLGAAQQTMEIAMLLAIVAII